jgi:hypothetical protein
MIASSSQPAQAPFTQQKAPTARQIRKAEKLEKRASMHGSRHPVRLDGAIGRLTQVRLRALSSSNPSSCLAPLPYFFSPKGLRFFFFMRNIHLTSADFNHRWPALWHHPSSLQDVSCLRAPLPLHSDAPAGTKTKRWRSRRPKKPR